MDTFVILYLSTTQKNVELWTLLLPYIWPHLILFVFLPQNLKKDGQNYRTNNRS